MKSIQAIKNELAAKEVLTIEQTVAIKGGVDKTAPRPGGGGNGLSVSIGLLINQLKH